MLEQKAERPQAGKGAAFGHQETESLTAGLRRGILNHLSYRTSGVAVLGIFEEAWTDLGSSQ